MSDGKEFIRGAIMTAGANVGSLGELGRRLGVGSSVISKYLNRGVLPPKVISPLAKLAGRPYTLQAIVMAAYRARIEE